MVNVHLHGSLKQKFGELYQLDIIDAAEAIRALSVQLSGFETAIRDGSWHVVRGNSSLDESSLNIKFGSESELHIMPAIAGSGSGTGKTILGAALIGASFFVPAAGVAGIAALSGGAVAVAGASLVLSGISTSLATQNTADYESQVSPDERASFLFDGPVNRAAQGIAVPIIIGEVKTGSVVVSAGLSTEQL